jgi:hypothetical protein
MCEVLTPVVRAFEAGKLWCKRATGTVKARTAVGLAALGLC